MGRQGVSVTGKGGVAGQPLARAQEGAHAALLFLMLLLSGTTTRRWQRLCMRHPPQNCDPW